MASSEVRTLNRRQVLQGMAASAVSVSIAGEVADAAVADREANLAIGLQEPTTVVFSATGDANIEQPVFQDLIEMFNSAQSDVVVQYQPFPEGGYEKAVAMLQAGTVPDIMRIDDDATYFISTSGRLHELTSYVNELNPADYFPYVFHELAVDGKLFALTMCDAPWCWMYNKQLYEEAGVAPPTSWDAAWDWETALANFRALAQKEGDFTLVYAGMVGHGEEMPYEAGVGHYNHDMTHANFNHPLNVEALRIAAQLQYEEQVCLPPGGGEPIDLFNANQLATISQVITNSVSLSSDIEWDFAPTPKAACYAFGAPYARTFVLPKEGPSNVNGPDAAATFFTWYLTSTEAQERVASGGWGIPPLKSVASSDALANSEWAQGRNIDVVIGGLEYAYPRNQAPFSQAMATYWKGGDQRDQVMLGDLPPEQFCEEVNQIIQEEIDKAISEGWEYVPPPHSDVNSTWTRWYYTGEAHEDDPRLACGLALDDPAV